MSGKFYVSFFNWKKLPFYESFFEMANPCAKVHLAQVIFK